MYKNVIQNYVQKLTLEDVQKYIHKNYSFVQEEEILVIYDCIKNHWEELYQGNYEILEKVKKKVQKQTYDEIIRLLEMAQKFLKK